MTDNIDTYSSPWHDGGPNIINYGCHDNYQVAMWTLHFSKPGCYVVLLTACSQLLSVKRLSRDSTSHVTWRVTWHTTSRTVTRTVGLTRNHPVSLWSLDEHYRTVIVRSLLYNNHYTPYLRSNHTPKNIICLIMQKESGWFDEMTCVPSDSGH